MDLESSLGTASASQGSRNCSFDEPKFRRQFLCLELQVDASHSDAPPKFLQAVLSAFSLDVFLFFFLSGCNFHCLNTFSYSPFTYIFVLGSDVCLCVGDGHHCLTEEVNSIPELPETTTASKSTWLKDVRSDRSRTYSKSSQIIHLYP